MKGLYGMNDDVILYWAHHEKLCLIDGRVAFMGGLVSVQLVILPVDNILEIKDARIAVVLAREQGLADIRGTEGAIRNER
jgi:hypothetical protein